MSPGPVAGRKTNVRRLGRRFMRLCESRRETRVPLSVACRRSTTDRRRPPRDDGPSREVRSGDRPSPTTSEGSASWLVLSVQRSTFSRRSASGRSADVQQTFIVRPSSFVGRSMFGTHRKGPIIERCAPAGENVSSEETQQTQQTQRGACYWEVRIASGSPPWGRRLCGAASVPADRPQARPALRL
jgi:hypothetical protein